MSQFTQVETKVVTSDPDLELNWCQRQSGLSEKYPDPCGRHFLYTCVSSSTIQVRKIKAAHYQILVMSLS